jgi:cysteine synthase A
MAKDPRYFNPDQFSNPLNVECHYRTTGQEIITQIAKHSGSVDAFVAGVGTGGTLIGTGKALREKYGKTHIAAVEPSESAVMSGGKPGMHSIQGIGDGFIPAIAGNGKGGLNPLIDEVICISTEDAKNAAKYLGSKGICVGVSSGANYLAAKKLRERFDTVATVFSDGFSKYVSQGLARSGSGPCPFTTECNCPAKNDCEKGSKTGNCKCG